MKITAVAGSRIFIFCCGQLQLIIMVCPWQLLRKTSILRGLQFEGCRMLRIFVLISLFLQLALHPAIATIYRVAIFDFDDRLDQELTTAKTLESHLKQVDQDITVDQFTGKGSVPHSVEVMKKLDDGRYDLILVITSDALVIAHHVIQKTPTLYTNVNNPLSLGCLSLEAPGGNISGVSYYVSIEKQLRFYKSVAPDIKSMGFIFDRYNKSRKVELPEAREACQKLGMEYNVSVVSCQEALYDTVKQMIDDGIDALAIGSSGMLYNNISRFISLCDEYKIPVFSFNKKGVKEGAVAALASDYTLMADHLLIPMAMKILKEGISPGEMPAAFQEESQIFLNLRQAEKLTLSISQDILEKAIFVQ